MKLDREAGHLGESARCAGYERRMRDAVAADTAYRHYSRNRLERIPSRATEPGGEASLSARHPRGAGGGAEDSPGAESIMLKGLRLMKCWKNFRRRQKRQRLILHGLNRLVKIY